MTKPTKTSAAMQKPDIERRAAELHEGCRMPMEQARALAASEASTDWYARGQDWALADAMSGSLPNDWTAGDIARAFAAGARAGEGVAQHNIKRMQAALAENASRLAEYWKAEHLAGNARIGELHDEAERLRGVLHRMLEAPTTQVSLTWKEAVRLALADQP